MVLGALSPIPESYSEAASCIAKALLARLLRDRSVDELVWSLALRYAHHRAEWDRLHAEGDVEAVAEAGEPVDAAAHFMTGREQKMAWHHKVCSEIEKQLLGTPYARARATGSMTTPFVDALFAFAESEPGDVVRIDAFKPLTRQAGR